MTQSDDAAPKLFLNEDMVEPLRLKCCGGEVVLFSSRCPGKATDNEDAAAVIPTGADSGALVVADGMGGGAAGEQASRIAVESLSSAIAEGVVDGHAARAGILNGIETANRGILSLGIGAGSTIVVLEVQGELVRPYHVGDSSLLIVGQRGKLKLQTVAHSPVGLAIEAGVLDDSEAMRHEHRHLVTNILGTEEMRMEIGPTRTLSRYDTALLASDGLFDNLTVEEIVDRIRKGPLLTAVERLASAARDRMNQEHASHPSKPDDLTIIAFRRKP